MSKGQTVYAELVDLKLVSSSMLREIVGLSRSGLRKWRKAGILPPPCRKISGISYWRLSVVRAWIKKHCPAEAAA